MERLTYSTNGILQVTIKSHTKLNTQQNGGLLTYPVRLFLSLRSYTV
jgi:hypothetical protein